MGATCNGCGHCCDPVVLPYSKTQLMQVPPMLREKYLSPDTFPFVMEHLTEIPRREGLKMTPYLTTGVTWGMFEGEFGETYSSFYECDLYDKENRRCTDWEHRPAICRGYPWYDDGPDASKALPEECSYIEDVPVELRQKATMKDVWTLIDGRHA